MKTVLGKDVMLLERFVGTEAVSMPFQFRVTMLAKEPAQDLQQLLRTPATVYVTLADETERPFHGIFRSVKQSREGADVIGDRPEGAVSNPARELTVYEGILVPKFWFLSLATNCRIFENMTVKDIVSKLLGEAAAKYDFKEPLGRFSTEQREYCVQYRETTFNFISRLCEELGVYYYFDHTEDAHTMVFAANSTIAKPCPKQETAQYAYSDTGITEEQEDGVMNLERVESAYTGKAVLTDYNFETPNLDLKSMLGGKDEEAFDFPGEYQNAGQGSDYVKVRLEERESDQFLVNGNGRCRPFRPGYAFKLKDHYRPDTNKDYFLVAVNHKASDTTYRQDSDGAHSYDNTFSAMPKTIRYRPPRRARKPMIQGPQPARVVTTGGDEISVDKYGRVKVHFFWEREGKNSCWVRVSQIWAGKNWGWMTIPRLGQEVLVEFIEGNPDRPIITGRVYNADQMPPYDLPANQTQSGIKSRSSKAGGAANFNEIRFEDLKGSEMFTMHAEKNMETFVENDDTQTVQNNRKITVDGTHTETIKKDTTITVTEGNHSLTLNKGNQSITLDLGNQTTTLSKGNQSITLSMGNQSTKLDLGKATTEAMQSIELKVGASSIRLSQTGIQIKAMMITIEGSAMTTVKGNGFLTLKGGLTLIN